MKLRYGLAKVEYLANEPQIRKMIQTGMTKRMIYEELISKINMSYRRFCVILNNNFPELKQKRRKKTDGSSAKDHAGTEQPATNKEEKDAVNAPLVGHAESLVKCGPRRAGGQQKAAFGEKKYDFMKELGPQKE